MSADLEPWGGEVRDRITALCESTLTSVQVVGASVALVSSHGERAVMHATNEDAQALETIQIERAEGPCVDVATTYSPILIDDLQDPSEGLGDRWPFFMQEASKLGVRAVYTFPLHIGGIVLGSLELHRTHPGPLEQTQLRQAIRAAHTIGGAMVDGPMDANLGPAAAVVHQAAGKVMIQINSSIGEALAHLRATAFTEDAPLVDLAVEVVENRRHFTKESP